jgi:hypothetical protein
LVARAENEQGTIGNGYRRRRRIRRPWQCGEPEPRGAHIIYIRRNQLGIFSAAVSYRQSEPPIRRCPLGLGLSSAPPLPGVAIHSGRGRMQRAGACTSFVFRPSACLAACIYMLLDSSCSSRLIHRQLTYVFQQDGDRDREIRSDHPILYRIYNFVDHSQLGHIVRSPMQVIPCVCW